MAVYEYNAVPVGATLNDLTTAVKVMAWPNGADLHEALSVIDVGALAMTAFKGADAPVAKRPLSP